MDFSKENALMLIAKLKQNEFSDQEIESIHADALLEIKRRNNNADASSMAINSLTWQDAKANLLATLGKNLHSDERNGVADVLEHIKNRLCANNNRLMKLLMIEKLMSSGQIFQILCFVSRPLYVVVLYCSVKALRLIGLI